MDHELDVLVEGDYALFEGPCWHDGGLWFSDLSAYRVLASDLDGNVETIPDVRAAGSR